MRFVRFKSHNFILIIIFVAIVGFSGGYLFSEPVTSFRDLFSQPIKVDEKNINLNLFWEAFGVIQEKYIGRGNINYENVVERAVSGMVNSLGDPYTVFLDKEELDKFKEGIDGVFEGVGAEIGVKNNVITVIAPLEDSPAQRAGLRAGDKILKIDDIVTIDMTVEQAVERIRGPKGTTVALLISREGLDETRQINIKREVINVPSIKWELRDDRIAYIQLFRFGPDTGSEFKDIARQIVNSKADRIILDLRNNPGGFLETSVEVAGLFIPTGEIVVVEDYGDGKKDDYKTSGKPLLENYPMVVLVNQGSASASEILAGALRDQKNVKLIGEKTFGKGSVQELDTLKQGGAIKITVAKWLTPSGKSISDEGLKPDIEVKALEESENAQDSLEKDVQLDKAMEIVKGE